MNMTMNQEMKSDLIIIAEDSATQAQQITHILEKCNYQVLQAKNGKEALALIHERKPALVISDIIMPEMNGYELCQKLKGDVRTADIPVILLTSLDSTEDVLEGIACGADDFLTKPYSEQYLIQLIRQILANKQMYTNARVQVGMEMILGGKKHFITSTQQQMLTLLISTFEAGVHKNAELNKAQEELRILNERLDELIIKRTEELTAIRSQR
jgi:CheY-like chemotaxis protein